MSNKRPEEMVTAVFRDRMHANIAFDWLRARGYDTHDINVLMSDRTLARFRDEEREITKAGSKMDEGLAAGGVLGTAVGAAVGVITALGTSIVVPGLGIVVAGAMVAGLAGAGAGAVTGGLVGALIGLGIPESNARAYEDALKHGGVAIGVVPKTSKETSVLKEYFEQHHGENVVVASLQD
ncbi:MAG: DUF1269 domain-containing protein [Gemmataceae bacterium]